MNMSINDFEFLISLESLDFQARSSMASKKESRLKLASRLRVDTCESMSLEEQALKSSFWAHDKFVNEVSPDVLKWYMNAAYACVLYDLVSPVDGDSIKFTDPVCQSCGSQSWITPSSVAVWCSSSFFGCTTDWLEIINCQNLKIILNFILVAKIHWWTTGKHPESNRLDGLVQKYVDYYFPQLRASHRSVAKMINTVSKWASTRKALKLLGVNGIDLKTPSYVSSANREVAPVIQDLRIRMRESMPAGTEYHGLAVYGLKLIARSFMFKYTSLYVDSKGVLNTYNKIRTMPAKYHIRASELTSSSVSAIEFIDTAASVTLGRLGSFIAVFLSNECLAKSNLIRSETNKPVYQDYPDFDPEFLSLCWRVHRNNMDMNEVDDMIGPISEDRLNAIRQFVQLELGLSEQEIPPYLKEENQLAECDQNDNCEKLLNVYEFLFDRID